VLRKSSPTTPADHDLACVTSEHQSGLGEPVHAWVLARLYESPDPAEHDLAPVWQCLMNESAPSASPAVFLAEHGDVDSRDAS